MIVGATWLLTSDGPFVRRYGTTAEVRRPPGRPTRRCALVITGATRFRDRVELEQLRERRRSFVAPQSYRFVDNPELRALLNGQAADVAALTTRGALAI